LLTLTHRAEVRALSLFLITYPGITCVVLSLVSLWKENRFGWPLRGIIWFTVAIIGSCAVIAPLAGYVQKARSLEKVSHCVETVTIPRGDVFADAEILAELI
jgi:hypothetical protein